MQACLYEPLFYEWTIWRKPNTEEKRSFFEVAWTIEILSNPDFNRVQFEAVKKDVGLNRFVMTPSKWCEEMNSIGIQSKAGRYGGTYAHSDIAFEFTSWISPEFKLYIIKDYKRLKAEENSRLSLNWNLNRELSKLNYRIHTDAIKAILISVTILFLVTISIIKDT